MKEDRRHFLRVFGASAVTLAVPACALEPEQIPSDDAGTIVNVGDPSNYAAMGLHQVVGTVVLIGRDGNGLFALSSICTHQLCNMNKAGSMGPMGAHCNCHGSDFAVDGRALTGPAVDPLKHLALSLAMDGTLDVDTSTVVANETRLRTM